VTGFSPGTKAGKFLNFSCAFLVLLVVSAYTANLASLLVVSASVDIPIQSLEEAALKGIPVCTAFNPAPFAHMHNVHWRRHAEDRETYDGVRDGSCEVGIVRHFMWKAAQHEKHINTDCRLYMMEGSLITERSGLTTRLDSIEKRFCIDRAVQVFNLILVSMEVDGFFRRLNQKYWTSNVDSISCPIGLPTAPASSSGALRLKNMSGIFITYLIAVVIAFVMHQATRGRQVSHHLGTETDESDSDKLG